MSDWSILTACSLPGMGPMASPPESGHLFGPQAEESDILLELRLPALPDRLKLIREPVRQCARMCGFEPVDASDVVLAVDEACQNVIQHVYKGEPNAVLLLRLSRCSEGGIHVSLRDFGPSIDPIQIRSRPLDHLVRGGLGTHFIREIMDGVTLMPAPDGCGNLLQMVKHLS